MPKMLVISRGEFYASSFHATEQKFSAYFCRRRRQNVQFRSVQIRGPALIRSPVSVGVKLEGEHYYNPPSYQKVELPRKLNNVLVE